ncbi:MAG: hypothetical protein JWM45_2726 [Pseudonocardiales bacterium]|jgi:hypothetical protein|nr:hypothetical protein [Pseudonocardiales bacterium]
MTHFLYKLVAPERSPTPPASEDSPWFRPQRHSWNREDDAECIVDCP